MNIAALAAGLACSRANPAYRIAVHGDGSAQPPEAGLSEAGRPDGREPRAEPPAVDGGIVDLPGAETPVDVPPDTPLDLAADRPAPAPPALALTGANQQEVHGTSGPTMFPDVCPSNEVVIGFRGFSEDPAGGGVVTLQQLGLVCGVMSAASAASGYVVKVAAGTPMPRRGLTSGDIAFDMVCPADEVVIRIAGGAGSSLDKLQAFCGRLSLPAGGGPVTVQPGATLTARGGNTGDVYDDPCPQGQVVRGATIWYRQVIDAVQTVCGTPTATP